MDKFEDTFAKQTEEHGIGGGGGNDFWKPQEGENKIRIVATPELVVSRFKYGVCYEGAEYCKKENLGPKDNLTHKWLTWIIDRKTGQFKLYSLPFTVTKAITALKTNEEYVFEDFPMPYDVTLTVKNAGTKEAEYSIMPSRKETPLTESELAVYGTLTPVSDVISAMKEKARKTHSGAPQSESTVPTQTEDDIDPNEIPF